MSFFLVLCCTLFGNRVAAQITQSDEHVQKVTANMVTAYQKDIGSQSRLYRGFAYEFYDVLAVGNPFYGDSVRFTNGRVKYDGIEYKGIPLLYDQYRQVLVTFLYDNVSKVALLSDYVTEFDVRGRHFIRLVPDEQNKKMDVTFYNELYNNKLQVLVQIEKTRLEEGLTARKVFSEKKTYYLRKDGIYYNVNTKGRVLNVLNDKRKELKQYIKNSHIDFSEDRDRILILIAAYYDKISN